MDTRPFFPQLRRHLARYILIMACIWLPLAAMLSVPIPASAVSCTFRNPIVAQGQDPSVVYQEGYYYLVQSNKGKLSIRKSAYLTDLGSAAEVPIYTPPPNQPYSQEMWAPELEYLDNSWYIYFAADDGKNSHHRMYVLQANTQDPQGSWTFKGKLYDIDPATDKWAIDGSVFRVNGQLYMVWSGWPGDIGDFPQNLYISRMSDPLTISTPRHLLAQPDQPWEHSIRSIEEGPEAFIHNGQVSIVYAADASWTSAYKLGLLKLTGRDLLDAASWTKSGPVLKLYAGPDGAVYGTGHSSTPVPSPDGTEDWLIYAAKTLPTDGWDDRNIRAQRFTWNADNTPDFGQPIPAGVGVTVPSGEPCGRMDRWRLNEMDGTTVTRVLSGVRTR